MHKMKRKCLTCLMLFGFLLGSYNGYIALWTDSSIEPDRVYPYKISMLPEADQEALRKGIPAENIVELTRLMEDYLS